MSDPCPLSFPSIGLPQYHLLLYGIIPCVVSLLIVAINSTLIYTFYKTGQCSTVSNKLLIVLNTSDLTTGLFLPPYYIFLAYEIGPCGLKRAVEFICLISLYFSFNISCCITVDRYLHIKRANQYHDLMTNPRLIAIIGFAFFVASINIVALGMLPSFLAVLISCILSVCIIIIMALLNWSMKRSLNSHNARMVDKLSCTPSATFSHGVSAVKIEGTRANRQRNEPVKRQFQAVNTIKHLLISLTILFVPIDVMNIVFAYMAFESKSYPPLEVRFGLYISALMFISNSWINAVIIARGNNRCRAYISSHFVPKSCCGRPSQRRAQEMRSTLEVDPQKSRITVLELPSVA